MSRSTVPLKNPAKAAFLAWLVPGLGHFYQGRTGKGIDGITITRFSGDFIVQDTAVWDTLGLLRQLGVLPG